MTWGHLASVIQSTVWTIRWNSIWHSINTTVSRAARKYFNIKIILSSKVLLTVTRIFYSTMKLRNLFLTSNNSVLWVCFTYSNFMRTGFLVSNNNYLINWVQWHFFRLAFNTILKQLWNLVVLEAQANAICNSAL